MELVLTAPFGGVVKTIKVKAGDQVAEGALLAVIGKNDGMAISMLSVSVTASKSKSVER